MAKQASKIKSETDVFKTLSASLKNTITRPNVYGYKPHPKQQQFHDSTARGRLFIGGNRSGKTVGGAVECVWLALGIHPNLSEKFPPPCRIRGISVDFLNGVAKIMMPEIARWVPTGELVGGAWSTAYNRELRTLTFDNGSFIEFLSYDQDLDKHAGTSRHFIWFDEEPPELIFQENMMRLIDVGGSYIMTMTPVEGMTWVYDSFYMAAKTGSDPNMFVVEVDTTENPHLNPGEVDILLATMNEDERKARKQGKFVQVGGFVYEKSFSRERHVVEPFTPPHNWQWVAAMDQGVTNPTAWLWAAVDPEGRIFVFDEHYEAGKIVSYHAKKVHEKNQAYGIVPSYYVGDPSIRNIDPLTGTSVLIEYVENGIPILLGNNDQVAGLNKVKTYFEQNKLFITSNCVNLIHEIPRLRWSTWSNRKMQKDKNKREQQHKKDDHACDALRYLISSRPMYDVGEAIPNNNDPAGASVAVHAIHRTDPGATALASSRAGHDFTLGNEW